MNLNRLGMDAAPSASSSFALAYERLALEDEMRSAWLAQRCRRPDKDENDAAPLEVKERVTSRCCVRYCNRKPRAKGMCDKHYRAMRRHVTAE